MISSNICLTLSDLLHLGQSSLGPSMLLQLALFSSILWLSHIPLYICITYSLPIFICWWTFWLLPCLRYCKECCSEHWGRCVFSIYAFLQICTQEWTCWIIWKLYFILFYFISFQFQFFWNRVDLQCCVIFCCTAQWSSYTYIQSFLDSFPIQVITEYWVEFSVLYSRSLLDIYSSVYMSIPYTKINSKWIKDLNVRLDAIKLLEENIGRTLFHINLIIIFFDPSPRVMEIKKNKWDLIKLESFAQQRKP